MTPSGLRLRTLVKADATLELSGSFGMAWGIRPVGSDRPVRGDRRRPGVHAPPSLPEKARRAAVRVLPIDRFDAPSILARLVVAYEPARAACPSAAE